jgi:site-specific DNA recombinase
MVGGIPLTRGPLAHLLRNRFYIGQVVFKGDTLPGEQPPIVDRDLFEAVQRRLNQQVNDHQSIRGGSEALLMGRIFDDRGNRMTPSHVRKRGIKYRYYICSALLQGQPGQAGTVDRVPAGGIEQVVLKSAREHLTLPSEKKSDSELVRDHVAKVEVRADRLMLELVPVKGAGRTPQQKRVRIEVPWRKTSSVRRREILLPKSLTPEAVRPIRSESRALLVAAIARGRRWLDELMTDATARTESIANREGCTVRQVHMTISLAFLAPSLVQAAIEGRLPHGMGVTRLRDLPAEWSRQLLVLGL